MKRLMEDLGSSAFETANGAVATSPRAYHHGDLHRALLLAARRVLERDGAQVLSLRAVAREAGVSPAAPYHHFKDKGDLMNALAGEGFHALGDALRAEFEADPQRKISTIGLTYVKFARAHPALYRVMYDCARNEDGMPSGDHAKEDGGFQLLKQAMIRAGADPKDEVGLELACIAYWCAAHGVAEMFRFAQFKPIADNLGGEDAFIREVLEHLGYAHKARPS